MKTIYSFFRMRLVQLSAVLMLAVVIASCSKNDDIDNGNTQAAGLMAFNLAPDKPAILFGLSGNSITNTALGYTNYSGDYRPIFPGNREVESYDYQKDTTITKASFTFENQKYYSVFLTGANGVYSNVITRDNFDSLKAANGKAYVRYVNAIPDSVRPAISFTVNGNKPIDVAAAPYTSVSDFVETDAGQVAVSVNNGSTIQASRTITLEQNRIYTVLLAGLPGSTDTATAVQIKYIMNGSLDNNGQ